MRIMPNDLKRQFELYAQEYEEKALAVLRSGWYVLGNEVTAFENEFAAYIGTSYCVGLASGLDALWIGFKLLNICKGDEVIVCANAYIACIMGITLNDATPIFVEPDQYDNIDADKIESVITPNTKAILAVHLFGQACDMTKIMDIAHRYHLKVIEDCAQSHASKWKNKNVGTFGDIGCFSFYPTKNCGAFGDAGCIVTDDAKLADAFRTFRNYGSREHYQNVLVGANSRLDELQAGLLRIKLSHLDALNAERCQIAARYGRELNHPAIKLPIVRPSADSTWHQYVIHVRRQREELINYLKMHQIGTIIHYPIPPYLSEAYAYLGYGIGSFPITEQYACEVLSLPMYNGMTQDEQSYVIETINAWK
ncbi:MAG: DegT/DnrJ/EryC1/StrS family aminotransferase [Ruthenibacterium sp.]